MLARVLLVAGGFYGLGLALMLVQRRSRTGTTRTKWTKYRSYGLFLAVVLLLGYLGGVPFACAVLLAMGTALAELFRAATLRAGSRTTLAAAGVGVGVAAVAGGAPALYAAAIALALATLVVAALARDPPATVRSAMWGVMGLVAVATPAAHLLLLNERPERFALFAFLFLVVCCADAFAELVGRRWPLGRGLITVSPAKSLAGVVGGIAAGAVMALALQRATGLWSVPRALGIGVGAAIAATAGDLVASSFKRTLGIKDFGTLLPDHGGLLDRLDSLFFAALPFYWMVRI
jgi:phosphatidate cytidylyltransferase